MYSAFVIVSDKFILYTEAAAGASPSEPDVVIGSWERGEKYLENILNDLRHWVVGWTDWNLALNMTGGPNWANFEFDSPILVDATLKEFYKQPSYYAMGHVSRYFTEGSFVIEVTDVDGSVGNKGIVFAGAKRLDGGIVVTLMNKDEVSYTLNLIDPDLGYVPLNIEPSSMHSIIYWQS